MLGALVERYRFVFAVARFEVETAARSQFHHTFPCSVSSSGWQLVRVTMIHGDSLLLPCSIVKKSPQRASAQRNHTNLLNYNVYRSLTEVHIIRMIHISLKIAPLAYAAQQMAIAYDN